MRPAPSRLRRASICCSGQCRLQAVQVLFIRRNNDVRNTGRNLRVLESLMTVQDRPTPHRMERNRQREMWRLDMPDDNLRGRNLQEFACVGIALPIGSMHHERPLPTRLELKHFEGVAESIGAPPGRQKLRVGESRKDFG